MADSSGGTAFSFEDSDTELEVPVGAPVDTEIKPVSDLYVHLYGGVWCFCLLLGNFASLGVRTSAVFLVIYVNH